MEFYFHLLSMHQSLNTYSIVEHQNQITLKAVKGLTINVLVAKKQHNFNFIDRSHLIAYRYAKGPKVEETEFYRAIPEVSSKDYFNESQIIDRKRFDQRILEQSSGLLLPEKSSMLELQPTGELPPINSTNSNIDDFQKLESNPNSENNNSVTNNNKPKVNFDSTIIDSNDNCFIDCYKTDYLKTYNHQTIIAILKEICKLEPVSTTNSRDCFNNVLFHFLMINDGVLSENGKLLVTGLKPIFNLKNEFKNTVKEFKFCSQKIQDLLLSPDLKPYLNFEDPYASVDTINKALTIFETFPNYGIGNFINTINNSFLENVYKAFEIVGKMMKLQRLF